MAELLDDGLKPFLLGRREDEPDKFGETDSLVLALEHVLGVQGELEDAAPGLPPFVSPAAGLAG